MPGQGAFSGHWLSAAAMHYAATGETALKTRADDIVDKQEYTLRLRLPWWAKSYALFVDGKTVAAPKTDKGFVEVARSWKRNLVRLELKKELTAYPLPDEPDMVAFMDGPVALAGLCDEERILCGDKDDPSGILTPDNEREWDEWQNTYRTKNQERGIRFVPLNKVGYEAYTIYFPVTSKQK